MVALLKAHTLGVVVGVLILMPGVAGADRLGFYLFGGYTEGRDFAPMDAWVDAFGVSQGVTFEDWQSDPRWGLGFTFFKGRRLSGGLEIAIQDRRRMGKEADGTEWRSEVGSLSFSLDYAWHFVPVPAPVVPVVAIGGVLDMMGFSINRSGADVGGTPGAFEANGLSGAIRSRAGLEFFLGPEYSLGVYACRQVGSGSTMYVSKSGDALIERTMNLPTAASFAAAPNDPSAWKDLEFAPTETSFYVTLRYHFRLARAPGVAGP